MVMSTLTGRKFLWTFTEGPTSGKTYEHTFADDGSVSFGTPGGKPTRVDRYGAYEVSPDVTLVSYLAPESGYTLTVAMNAADGKLYGFASNDKEWYPVSGTFEVQ